MQIYLIFDLINVNDKYSPWDQNQIGIKLGKGYIIYQNVANFIYEKDIHFNRLESVIFDIKCVFYWTKQHAKGRLNFECLDIPTDRAWKRGHFSSYHVYSQSYSY